MTLFQRGAYVIKLWEKMFKKFSEILLEVDFILLFSMEDNCKSGASRYSHKFNGKRRVFRLKFAELFSI
jgi:hypothetical protein